MWEVITTDVFDEWFDSLDDANREDVLAGLLLLFIRCEKFFDIEPIGKTNEESFYSNINEFQIALNSVYSVLREPDFQKILALIGDGLSDDFIYQYTNSSAFGEDGLKLQNFNI